MELELMCCIYSADIVLLANSARIKTRELCQDTIVSDSSVFVLVLCTPIT